MATYFASDVHLRIDRPERSRRFADWVQTLKACDSLIIVGDLCDFWFASRQRRLDFRSCVGLSAARDFVDRGGSLSIIAGNHDLWLGPFYEQSLGGRFLADSLSLVTEGIKIHAIHGHLLGARSPWKGIMESRWFLDAFRRVPERLAAALEQKLDASNDVHRARSDRRHLDVYRKYSASLANVAELVVLGHIHRPQDEIIGEKTRMIVLGGWILGSSRLKIADGRAEFHHESLAQANPT